MLEKQGIEIEAVLPAVLGRGGKATAYCLEKERYVQFIHGSYNHGRVNICQVVLGGSLFVWDGRVASHMDWTKALVQSICNAPANSRKVLEKTTALSILEENGELQWKKQW
jgi:hypothetical protein